MNDRWRPTNALVRAALMATALGVVAVVVGRPDLLVLVAPLAVHTLVAAVRRPRLLPSARSRIAHAWVREGEGTVVRTSFKGAQEVEHAMVSLARPHFTVFGPGSVVGRWFAGTGESRVDVPVASTRWGRRPVGDGVAGGTSAWAGYVWGPVPLYASLLTTLPMPGAFDSRAPVPHPIGLVGTNPARRPGEGSEFASIRPFTTGDRLRRIHWRSSLRTGALHVTSTVAEQDSSVLLVVDASVEVGDSGGTHGAESSLDRAVRAAGAVAEHYLSRGDRVGLRVLGSTQRKLVPVGSGHRQLRRMLDTLASATPGDRRTGRAAGSAQRFHLPEGTVVIVFSPMLGDGSVTAATTLARRGLSVVVVDTLPEGAVLADQSATERVAWRLRLLERKQVLSRIARTGIPVVTWHGPGSLDVVLRRLSRRATAPRLAR